VTSPIVSKSFFFLKEAHRSNQRCAFSLPVALYKRPPAREPFRSVSEFSLAFWLFFWQKPSHASVIHARQSLKQAD
jgi:hypothetical protein